MPESALPTVLRFGVFELDLVAGELRKAGARLRLQKQPFQILRVLVQRQDEIVTRDELRSEIWSADTFVDFDNSLNTSINKLRDVLGDTSSSPRFIETVPRRGYRFIAPVTSNGYQQPPASPPPPPAPPPPSPPPPSQRRSRANGILASALVLLLLVLAGLFWSVRRSHPLLQKGTIVLGGFANRTGDSVFDGTLKQGLSVQLEQSPQLRVLPEEQVHDTLRMMGRADTVELTPDVTREVCQRSDAAVALDGSISLIGSRYDLILRAVDCTSGALLGSAEAQSPDKDRVLDAVSKLASDMRRKLGESFSSLRQYNTPLVSATTPSMAALRCYTQGVQSEANDFDYKASLSWFQKAMELDPHFAMAYWALGDAYGAIGESNTAKLYIQKAFELREPVSQREKWLIEGGYYYYVVGDLTAARRSFELMAKVYPDSQYAHNSVADVVETLGEYNTGLAEYLQALHLPPRSSFLYRDVSNTYLLMDRVDDASAEVQSAHAAGLDANLAAIVYSIAFYRGDHSEMTRQVASVAGKPGIEHLVLALDADTAAYFGQLDKARGLSQRAEESAERVGQEESSAQYYATSAVREGLFGNSDQALRQSMNARKYSGGRDLDYGIALAVTYSGNLNLAQALTDAMAGKFPKDTIVQCNYLPTLRARLELMALRPQQALDALAAAAPCEFSLPSYSYYNWPNLYPLYVRGEAYLAAHRSVEAAAEFQKILIHRGLVLNEPIGALAYLQLGRAYALSGDTVKARASYEQFLTLWKDAEGNVPLLKQAKAEYASLLHREDSGTKPSAL
jgi:DNA-binding winged helix-turn-helix (wHTH) protein/tetratricopeptide (TPR) repeat protein